MEEGLLIHELQNSDAAALSALLCSQPPSYLRFFTPFHFAQPNISRLLAARENDLWLGLRWDGVLVGFFMLRGWDEGFEVPSYGGMVDQKFTGCGFGRLSLKIAKNIAGLRRATRLRLKVNRQNEVARRLFEEAGFKLTHSNLENDDLIYHYELPQRPARI